MSGWFLRSLLSEEIACSRQKIRRSLSCNQVFFPADCSGSVQTQFIPCLSLSHWAAAGQPRVSARTVLISNTRWQ